jgi:hypothetical protein
VIVIPALMNGAQNVPLDHFNSSNTLMNAHRCLLARFRIIYAMSNEHSLMLQANIICLLLFLVGTAAMIRHPARFQ